MALTEPPMTAAQYAPARRLDEPPTGPVVTPEQREQALRDALRGVELGAYDWRVLGSLLRSMDARYSSIDEAWLRTIVSLLERAHRAGIRDALAAQAALQRFHDRQRGV